ncbi:MAG: hypothetical protein PF904_17370 [Kiritimatiellae bacterium]|jgi:vesicle coat complex subunit|nr:hypothetical protein [Kiritimatiellia bacterium]
MGRYEKDARQHANMILHYYDHADSNGYSQADYHYCQLSDLIIRASKSKNDQNDVVVIQTLKESAERLMRKMKEREVEIENKNID